MAGLEAALRFAKGDRRGARVTEFRDGKRIKTVDYDDEGRPHDVYRIVDHKP